MSNVKAAFPSVPDGRVFSHASCLMPLFRNVTQAIARRPRRVHPAAMRICLPLVLLAAVALPALAGEASGDFTVTKRPPIRPKYASAYETRDQRDAHKRAIEVVLSDEPIDVKAAVAGLGPTMDFINQRALRD